MNTATNTTMPIDLPARREYERQKYLKLLDLPRYSAKNHGRFAYDLVRQLSPRFVIDLGCGDNQFIRRLRRFGIDGIGVDWVHPEADVMAPMHRVPLTAHSADVITSFDALEHLLPVEVDEVLDEMRRLAVLSGHFVVSVATLQSRWCGMDLHPTLRPIAWWMEKLSRVGSPRRQDRKYIVGRFKDA